MYPWKDSLDHKSINNSRLLNFMFLEQNKFCRLKTKKYLNIHGR